MAVVAAGGEVEGSRAGRCGGREVAGGSGCGQDRATDSGAWSDHCGSGEWTVIEWRPVTYGRQMGHDVLTFSKGVRQA